MHIECRTLWISLELCTSYSLYAIFEGKCICSSYLNKGSLLIFKSQYIMHVLFASQQVLYNGIVATPPIIPFMNIVLCPWILLP